MEKRRILELAWLQSLDLWSLHDAKSKQFPDDKVMKYNADKSWEESEKLHKMLLDEEARIEAVKTHMLERIAEDITSGETHGSFETQGDDGEWYPVEWDINIDYQF